MIVVFAVSARADDPFFGVPGIQTQGLPADGIYPDGQQIGFGIYSALGQENTRRVAEGGFTLLGPYYHYDWRWDDFHYARRAAELGVGFTYQIRPPEELYHVPYHDRAGVLAQLTDEQIRQSVSEQVGALLTHPVAGPVVARWSLMLEELRYWNPQEVRYLSIAAETIRQTETDLGADHRPFWMYEPNHRTQNELAITGRDQDLIGKGVYMTTRFDRGDQRSGYALWSFDQITAAAEQLERTPQAFFQLSEDFTDPVVAGDADKIRQTLRHDVYLGLVKGVRGVQVWSMHEDRPNLTTHEEQFQAYASVAEELTGDLNLQRPLLFGERRNDLRVEITAGDSTIEYTHSDGAQHSYPSLHWVDAVSDDGRYLLLVNSGMEDLSIRLNNLPDKLLIDRIFDRRIDAASSSYELVVRSYDVLALRLRGWTGDFNFDGTVDAADYTVWRDALAEQIPLGPEAYTRFYIDRVNAIAAAASSVNSAPEAGALSIAAALASLASASQPRQRPGR